MLKPKIKIISLLFPIVLLAGSFAPVVVSARGLVPCGGYSDNQGTHEKPCNVQDVFALFARVTNFLIAFAGVYAVYQIVNAGFWLIVSAGNEEAVSTQKKALTNAVIGFVLVMVAYLLINTVINLLLLS